MRLSDFLRVAWTNLSRRKTRTILTALSMAIGVTCILVLISVGIGYEQAYRESVEAMGSLTKIDVSPPADSKGKTALLNEKAVLAFKNLVGVEAVTPVLQATAYLKSKQYVAMVKLYGIDLNTAKSFSIAAIDGELPGLGTRLTPQILLSDDIAASFADPQNWREAVDSEGNPLIDPLHANIKLTFDYASLTGDYVEGEDGRAVAAGKLYQTDITGICSALNYTYSYSGFIAMERLQELIEANEQYLNIRQEKGGAVQTYPLVWVKVAKAEDVQAIATTIKRAGFAVYSLTDMLDSVAEQTRRIQGLLAAIGGVALLVAGLSIANTMMMAINERRVEVGVLKVLGSELSDIAAMFLTEAAMIGVIGGAAGLGLSFALQALLSTLLASLDVRSVIPLWLALGGLGFSAVVAIVSALAPAIGAMRISPLCAIRDE